MLNDQFDSSYSNRTGNITKNHKVSGSIPLPGRGENILGSAPPVHVCIGQSLLPFFRVNGVDVPLSFYGHRSPVERRKRLTPSVYVRQKNEAQTGARRRYDEHPLFLSSPTRFLLIDKKRFKINLYFHSHAGGKAF